MVLHQCHKALVPDSIFWMHSGAICDAVYPCSDTMLASTPCDRSSRQACTLPVWAHLSNIAPQTVWQHNSMHCLRDAHTWRHSWYKPVQSRLSESIERIDFGVVLQQHIHDVSVTLISGNVKWRHESDTNKRDPFNTWWQRENARKSTQTICYKIEDRNNGDSERVDNSTTYSLFLSLTLALFLMRSSVTCLRLGNSEPALQCWNINGHALT